MFGETVRVHRLRLGLTQEELAAKCDLSARAIRKIESGQVTAPRLVTVRLLADVFGLHGRDRDRFCAAAQAGSAAQKAQPFRSPAAGPPPGVASAPVPRQLPPDLLGFAGRVAPLAELDALLDRGDETSAVVISAVSGTAGVGKTALAIHWAHHVAHRFPDGQLYANLRGFDPGGAPLPPDEVLHGFLDALHVPLEQIRADLPSRMRLYRSLLADRRVLVVLDNARDAEQVRPLLPGAAGCLVLVTSRSQLGSLVAVDGAHPVTLDLLSDAEAWQLLACRLGSDRVSADPAAVDEIVTRCARLPLALAVVAARAATHPRFPLALLAAELRDLQGGLAAFSGEDGVSDVRTVLSWSYRSLTEPAARLFRLLGLHPGADIGTASAASLAGVPVAQVKPLLTELARAHLLSERLPGRFTFHDLLRAHALELAGTVDPQEERRDARHRLLDHYLHTALAAAPLVEATRRPIEVPAAQDGVTVDRPADLGRALSWFDAERQTLVSAVSQAAAYGFDRHSWQLAWACSAFLHRRGHWQDHAAVQRAALAAAARAGDRMGEALALSGLAQAYGQLTRYHDAHTHFQRALAVYRHLGDSAGCASTHTGLSWILEHLGRPAEALRHAYRALELFRQLGDRAGEARALNSVGWRLTQVGGYRAGRSHCEQAIAMLEELGDRYALAATWDSLGYAHHRLGDQEQATDCFRRAIALCQDVSDRYDEALFLTHLGDARLAADDVLGARKAWERSREILREVGHPAADEVGAKLREVDGAAAVRD